MGVIRINTPESSSHAQKSEQGAAVLRLELSHDEVQILLKACQRYRATIPSYLKAKQTEVHIIDSLIDMLTE